MLVPNTESKHQVLNGSHIFVSFMRILGNLRFDDGNINDNATNQLFDWLNEEK